MEVIVDVPSPQRLNLNDFDDLLTGSFSTPLGQRSQYIHAPLKMNSFHFEIFSPPSHNNANFAPNHPKPCANCMNFATIGLSPQIFKIGGKTL